jgi:hypothetical protein
VIVLDQKKHLDRLSAHGRGATVILFSGVCRARGRLTSAGKAIEDLLFLVSSKDQWALRVHQ